MKKETVERKIKDGEFKCSHELRKGANVVRYQTGTGKWKEKTIDIT